MAVEQTETATLRKRKDWDNLFNYQKLARFHLRVYWKIVRYAAFIASSIEGPAEEPHRFGVYIEKLYEASLFTIWAGHYLIKNNVAARIARTLGKRGCGRWSWGWGEFRSRSWRGG